MVPSRRSRTAALPLVTAGAGALLAALAVALAVQSNELLRGAVRAECLARAGAIVQAASGELEDLAVRAARGEHPDGCLAVWRLGGAAPEPGPPAGWLAEIRAYRGGGPLPLGRVGADGRRRAATWLPGPWLAERTGGADRGGVLVEWGFDRLRQGPLRGLTDGAGRYVVALAARDEPLTAVPFHVRAVEPLAAPLEAWRVAVGLRDAGGIRRELQLQTTLLGLLAAALLALLGGSLYAYVRRQRDRVREAAAREQFLARATHELQTPLALLRAAVETIGRGAAEDPADHDRCLAIVSRQEERLTRAVRRLLRYLRLQAADGEEAVEGLLGRVAPLGEVLGQAVDEGREALEARGLALEVAVADDAAGRGTPSELLRDTITELLANAGKHAAGATCVTVRAEARGDGWAVTVADDGSGVADPEALFEPWRGGGEGSGLGLALLREGWALAGGTIAWRRGAGAAFEVTLPKPARPGPVESGP